MTDRALPPLKELFGHLNEQQFAAVTAPNDIPLQVVAGPGTGKTLLLICRVAYLLLYKSLDPSKVIVTTFTKKAAMEMKERLQVVLMPFPHIQLNTLIIGTFHSICYKILKRYGNLSVFPKDFKIADEQDANQVLKEIVDKMPPPSYLNKDKSGKDTNMNIYKRFISSCKAYHRFPDEVPEINIHDFPEHIRPREQERFSRGLFVYSSYQQAMKDLHMIDFDDCLLGAHRLLTENPNVMSGIEHILVDEFQDTNSVQLELMFLLSNVATIRKDNVTVVGDPDQSIYGFRDSLPSVFKLMEDHYRLTTGQCSIVYLTQNYRSTESILKLSENLMKQQTTERSERVLHSNVDFDERAKLITYATLPEEATHIAETIECLMEKNPDLTYSDFVIVLRANFLARNIEKGLLKRHIPYTILRGHSFFELKEIKVVIDYLRCTISDSDWLAYSRILNFPKRNIGDSSIKKIGDMFNEQLSSSSRKNVYQFLQAIASKEILVPGLRMSCTENIASFLYLIDSLRKFLLDSTISELAHIFDKIMAPEDMKKEFIKLKKSNENEDTELGIVFANISGLKDQLLYFIDTYSFYDDNMSSNVDENSNQLVDEEGDSSETYNRETGAIYDEADMYRDLDCSTILEKFLSSINMYTVSGAKENDSTEPKVVISSIHASKGLEWPVVFIPTLCDGILPSNKSMGDSLDENVVWRKIFIKSLSGVDDSSPLDEELRCLYVATTRAKRHLFLSTVENETVGSLFNRKHVTCRFLAKISNDVEKIIHSSSSEGSRFYSPRKPRYSGSGSFKDYSYDSDDEGNDGRIIGIQSASKFLGSGSQIGSRSSTPGYTHHTYPRKSKTTEAAPPFDSQSATLVSKRSKKMAPSYSVEGGGATVLVPNPDRNGPPFIRQVVEATSSGSTSSLNESEALGTPATVKRHKKRLGVRRTTVKKEL